MHMLHLLNLLAVLLGVVYSCVLNFNRAMVLYDYGSNMILALVSQRYVTKHYSICRALEGSGKILSKEIICRNRVY